VSGVGDYAFDERRVNFMPDTNLPDPVTEYLQSSFLAVGDELLNLYQRTLERPNEP
jgi:hypothetical protein